MPLDEEARKRRARYKKELDDVQAKEVARAEEKTRRDTKRQELFAENLQDITNTMRRIGERGEKASQDSIHGYESWVTIMLRMKPAMAEIGELSGAIMCFTVGLPMQILPVDAFNQYVSNSAEDVWDAVKAPFQEIPAVKIPDILFFADMTNDNKLHFLEVKLSDDIETTQEDKQVYETAVKDWIRRLEQGRYMLVSSDPANPRAAFKIHEKGPGGIAGAELTQAEFRRLRDDVNNGLKPFLEDRFGHGVEQMLSPSPRP